MATVSYGQGKTKQDSVKLSIDDYSIFIECCIRQTGLEKDTLNLSQMVEAQSLHILNLKAQVSNLNQVNLNLNHQAFNCSQALNLSQQDFKAVSKKNKTLRIGLFTLTPTALIGGIWLGSKLVN